MSADTPVRVEVHPGREAVVEFDPDLTFECVDSCTWCCHHGVMLYDREFFELGTHADLNEATTEFRGEDFVRREEKDHDETAEDGCACHFLRGDGLCELQAENGWKPARCFVYPVSIRKEDGEMHVDIRESAWDHCEGMNESDRKIIDHLDAFLPEYLWDVENPDSVREL